MRGDITESSVLAVALNVISVGTIASVLRELIPKYEHESGSKVHITYGNPAATLDRLRQGATADVVIIAQSVWHEILNLGAVNPDTKTILAITSFGVGIKSATKKPDISTAPAFRRALEHVRSIALVDRSPATATLLRGIERSGHTSSIKAKVKLFVTGEAVAEAIAHGEVDLGITTNSELLAVKGVDVIGVVPSQIMTDKAVTVAAVTCRARDSRVAKQFIDFLCSPSAKALFASKGHEPVR